MTGTRRCSDFGGELDAVWRRRSPVMREESESLAWRGSVGYACQSTLRRISIER